ncbi:MAG TPA: OpcA/G6PD domain-containing protein, partial [Isosphaeraceae bacterium]|nr:OpcA/G6PD domain-containing protein [Isosphaeraceae bacterium]
RELVAQFFDGCGRECLAHISKVEIRADAPDIKRPPRVAAWLAAWLAGQLDWKPGSRRATAPGTLEASFQGPSGAVELAIRTALEPKAPFGRLTGVTLNTADSAGSATYRLDRPAADSQEVRVEVNSPRSSSRPRLLRAPIVDAACRVSAALESSRIDPPYKRALPIMLWLLE